MKAYVIADVRAKNPVMYQAYRERAQASIALHGGRYLARGGAIQVMEGCWQPQTIVVIEFDSVDAAKGWYESDDYAEALALRDDAFDRDLILVDGVAGDSD
jgi:uncharacterized protein (DUF1330 family)